MDRREFLARATSSAAALTVAVSGTRSCAAEGGDPVTRVEEVGRVPTFTIDGCPILAPSFETYAPATGHFRQFAAAGTRIFGFSTNAAACDYGHSPPTWVEERGWDYAHFEQRASQVLAVQPAALLLPRVNLGTPRWWLDRHPEALERFDDGATVPGGAHPTLPSARAFPSLASPIWREAIGEALWRLIQHVQRSRFGSHIFGWVLSGLHTEEFYHWACSTDRLAGYSEPTVSAFREWLRTRYEDDAAIQEAWNAPSLTLDTAEVPSRERRRDSGDGVFRDPGNQQDVLDFYAFWNDLIPDTIDYFAKVARRATSGRKVVGAFYGYLYEFAGDPEFGHNAVGKLVQSPHLDFMAVTASYFSREAGTGGDYARSPALSLQLHGKLWYHDNDVVSFRAKEIMQHLGYRNDADWTRNLSVQLASLGYTDTPEKSRWMYQRGFGFSMCHGMFPCWFDLHGGYFDAPELMAEVKRLGRLARRCSELDRSSCAEVLVIADETTCALAAPGSPLLAESLREPQNQLIRLGAPVDHLLIGDLNLVDVTPYRLVLFLNCWRLDARQRRVIRDRLMNQSRHLLWCGGAGWFDERRATAENSERLTGFQLARRDDARRPFALPPGPRVERPFAGDPTEAQRARAVARCEPSLAPQRSAPAAGRGDLVEKTNDFELAVREVARLEHGDWVSLWSPTAALPAKVFRELARAAGVHIYNNGDDVLYVNRSLVCLHANGDGPRELRFPSPVDLVDLSEDREITAHVTRWDTVLSHGETVLLQMRRPNDS